MLNAENANLRERVYELERKVQSQEDELVSCFQLLCFLLVFENFHGELYVPSLFKYRQHSSNLTTVRGYMIFSGFFRLFQKVHSFYLYQVPNWKGSGMQCTF